MRLLCLNARRGASLITRLVLIAALVVSLFPLLPASRVSAGTLNPDYNRTPPAGWTLNQQGLNWTNSRDNDDATFTDGGVNGGESCSDDPELTPFRRCPINVYFTRSSGVTSFDAWSVRVKAKGCSTGWPTFETCGTNYSIVRVRVTTGWTWFAGDDVTCHDEMVAPTQDVTVVFNQACRVEPEPGSSGNLRIYITLNDPGGGGGHAVLVYSAEVSGIQGDYGSDKPFGYAPWNAYSPQQVNLATGNFVNRAEDLAMPGRLLGFAFVRSYNSADPAGGPLGPGWTHSYNWQLTDGGATVTIRRGDGRLDTFTRNPDLTYAAPLGVFDGLVKNPDTTFTLTLTNQVAFAFTSAGVLTRISEPAGNQINLSYTSGKLTTVTDTVGRAVALSYTGVNLTQIQDPLGRKLTYGYDGAGRLSTVTDKIGNTVGQNPLLHQWRYGYDGTTRHLTTITDPDGRVRVTNTYDTQGRVYQQRDGMMNLTTFDFSIPGQTVATDPRGHATTYSFDSLSREQSEVDVVGGNTYTLTNHYNAAGNRDYVIDRRGYQTDFEYDTRWNMTKKKDPLVPGEPSRYETIFEYDTKNNLTLLTDALGFTTTNTYHATTNVKLSTSAQITTGPATYALTKWEYGDALNPGLPTKVISPRGNVNPSAPNYTYSQSLSYDASANLIQVIDADNSKTTFGYDGVGRQTTMVDPDGYSPVVDPAHHTWTTNFDQNDRVFQTIDPLGHSAFSGYDGAGNRISSTDRNGNITSYSYDDAARLESVTQKPDPVGSPLLEYTTTVARDLNGNAEQVTQANGVVTDYGYDALNRLTSVATHPTGVLNLTTSYVLDGNGNATSRTTGDGVVTTYVYDPLSRLTSVTSAGLPVPIGYTYDRVSRRKTMTDGTGTSTYTYDGLGRLTQAVQPNGTLGYAYDLDSNRTTLTYPTVGSVTYVFSPSGRLSTVTDWASRLSTYTYTAAGLAKTVVVPGGMTTTYTYDEAQRLRVLANTTATATISSHTYTLDNEGNRTAIDEVMNGIFASAKVNSDTGTTVQDHPDIAIGADAATYLIWDDARDGNANIYFDRRDPATGLWGTTDVKVNTDTGNRIQQNPAIAVDSSNNVYAVWQDERNGAGKADIFFRKRTTAGTWVSPDVKVSDDPGASGGAVQRNPRIAGTSAGAETAVWVDLRSSQNNIYSSLLAAGGSTWAVNKKITDNTAAVKDFPDVAVGSDGTSYAVWQDSRNGNADVFFSTLAPGGANWAANVKISDDPGSTAQTKPRMGIDAAGNLLVAWIDARTSPARVRAARKPFGGAWSASVEVSPSPANVQSLALSVRPDGYAWVTWGDTRAGASNSDIWGSRYDPYLNTWSPPQRVDDATGTTAQLSPTVAFTATETMLGWRDNRLSANGDTQARRVVFLPGLTDHFALTYDGLNRLTSVKGPVSETFTLDQASNIDSRTGPTQDFTYDEANRLTGDGALTYTWWDADRLKTRGTDTFNYDALERLKDSTVAGALRTYAYNGDGLLQTRTEGTASSLLWDPATDPSRLLMHAGDRVVYGLGPLYVVKADASTRALVRDGSKSVRAEVSVSGSVTGSWRYRVYGQLHQWATAPNPTMLGYTGQLLDSSGLYYMRARWYDASTARWLSRDAMLGESGAPATLNGFNYASATPLMSADASGLRDAAEVYGAGCDDSCNATFSKSGTLGCFDVAYCNFNNNVSGQAVGGFVGFAVPTLSGLTMHADGKGDSGENEIAAGGGPGTPPTGSKERARQILAALSATPAQRAAANRAIGRATTSSAIEVVREGANVVVKITRKGRDGYQVMESVVGADGSKSVVQRTVDGSGRETLDPKTP